MTTIRLIQNAPLADEPDNWLDCDDCLDYAQFLIETISEKGTQLSKQCIYCYMG